MDEGIAVINGRTVEWWTWLEKYLMEETKPLYTNFVLPDQRLALCYTCPVYFGSFENKQEVLDALCNEIHSKVLNQWRTFACDCRLVPILKLSQTLRNKNKVLLSCPKNVETRCGYFQWVHQPPKPTYVPQTATRSALRKPLNDMVHERMRLEKRWKRPKVEVEETIRGFKFP